MVNLTQTLKLKIKPQSVEQTFKFEAAQKAFTQACNFTSQYIFDHHFLLEQRILQDRIYKQLRSDFGLPSMLAQSVIKTVIAKYKTTRTQFRKEPWVYRDINTGKMHRTYKTLEWLRKPIQFKQPILVLVRNYNYTIRQDGSLSLGTLDGREIVQGHWDVDFFQPYLTDPNWKFGATTLLKRNNQWYLHISVMKKVPDFETDQVRHVVGIDRGLRQITTTYDEKGQTSFVNGQSIIRTRRKYKNLRSQLQAKGTKSAKRRLKKLNGRENRWMNDLNHQISKALVTKYPKGSLFVLEDLTGVRFATEQHVKDTRYESVSWSFYDLEQKLMYKAAREGSLVLKVDASYTSQRCPKCGTIHKESRNHAHHIYHCTNCGYQSNDDRVAAMNLYELGKQFISGVEDPHYEKVVPKQEQ